MAGQSKASAKHGRNSAKCKSYAAAGKRDRNKLKKVVKHAKAQPGDACAAKAVVKLKERVLLRAFQTKQPHRGK